MFIFIGVQKEQQILERICHHLSLENFSADEFVFHYGEVGNKFYILLEGSVGVLIPRAKFNYTGENTFSKAASENEVKK